MTKTMVILDMNLVSYESKFRYELSLDMNLISKGLDMNLILNNYIFKIKLYVRSDGLDITTSSSKYCFKYYCWV